MEIKEYENEDSYKSFSENIVSLLELARHQAARSVNAILTATYWEIGRRIVEFEQDGKERAGYGERILERLSADLKDRFGRGFSRQNLQLMRQFFLEWEIRQTVSGEFDLTELGKQFPLSWSQYVRLLSLRTPEARRFYAEEARRGGWSIRQLNRQIDSMFYERTALSRDKAAMLTKHTVTLPEDAVTVEQEIKDPYILEFLNLKDEYSETDLEEGLVKHLEAFLLELGNDFTFVARQKRIRIGDTWFRIDLLLYHRRLRSLVIIDLKIGRFSHADAGQMNLYVNYAAEHLTVPGENPPIGLILCSEGNAAEAYYALNGMVNRVLTAEYRLTLPDPAVLEAEIDRTRHKLAEARRDLEND